MNKIPFQIAFVAGILATTILCPQSVSAQNYETAQQNSLAGPTASASTATVMPTPPPSTASTPVLAIPNAGADAKYPVPPSVIPVVPDRINLAPPAKRFGDGIVYIGHRYYEEKGGGWGWIKKEGESWGSAKWVVLKEDPIHGILTPSRRLGKRDADQNYEYKMTGYFSDKEAYDPHLDETDTIFVLESYQSLGPVKPLDRKPGPASRFGSSKKSGFSSRSY